MGTENASLQKPESNHRNQKFSVPAGTKGRSRDGSISKEFAVEMTEKPGITDFLVLRRYPVLLLVAESKMPRW